MELAEVLRHLLEAPPEPIRAEGVVDFWREASPRVTPFATSMARAAAAGFLADRIGFAFVGGYRAALSRWVPDLAFESLACLSATESGGAHPRAIHTSLAPRPDAGFVLDGEKTWSTLAPLASEALVVARAGEHADGRPRLVVVRTPLDDAGVEIETMPAPAFAPEVPHAIVRFSAVTVRAEQMLEGDGYERYLKPFRTVEDLHVHASLLGYWISVARRSRLPRDLVERSLGLFAALSVLAEGDPLDPALHVALGGAITDARALVTDTEAHWDRVASPERERWLRDAPLLRVAERARAARLERAWQRIG
jgi:acyl-CoA dehydrogenase